MSGDESEDGEGFVENVPITRVFGFHPRARVVAAMLTDPGNGLEAFTENELRRITGLDGAECSAAVDALREAGIVERTDADAMNEPAYRLRPDRPPTDAIFELNERLAEHFEE